MNKKAGLCFSNFKYMFEYTHDNIEHAVNNDLTS